MSAYLLPDRRGPVLRRMRDLYAAEVTMTDRWLAVLLERLRDLSLERETIVLLVSAHGYLFGELQLHSVSCLGLSWLRSSQPPRGPDVLLTRVLRNYR